MKFQSPIPVRWFIALIATAAVSLAPISVAQVPQDPGSKAIPLSRVERKNKAPVSDQILRVKIPKPTEITLPNGLTVLVLEDHRLPLVTARLSILGAGALNDPVDVPGLANITATMLKEGTTTRSSKQIAEQTEELGASIGAQAPWASETATFTASGLSDNAGQWIALASDILLHPSFPEGELNKLKQRMKVQLQQQRSAAGFLMQERFNRAVYGNHPAAITSPTLQALDKNHARHARRVARYALCASERHSGSCWRHYSRGSDEDVLRSARLEGRPQ